MGKIIVFVPEEMVLELFGQQVGHEFVKFPIMTVAVACTPEQDEIYIPRDYLVKHCFYSPERQAYGYTLSHAEFGEVKRGEFPPTYIIKQVTFRLKRREVE